MPCLYLWKGLPGLRFAFADLTITREQKREGNRYVFTMKGIRCLCWGLLLKPYQAIQRSTLICYLLAPTGGCLRLTCNCFHLLLRGITSATSLGTLPRPGDKATT